MRHITNKGIKRKAVFLLLTFSSLLFTFYLTPLTGYFLPLTLYLLPTVRTAKYYNTDISKGHMLFLVNAEVVA